MVGKKNASRLDRVLVILGPTATGKTDLAIRLAKMFDGEIVSCDSRQLYQGLDIGSGKLPGSYESLEKDDGRWVVDGVVIWGYDLASPLSVFNVKDYLEFTRDKIRELINSGKLPIVVGGTGLYLRALLHGLSDLVMGIDLELRGELEQLSLGELREKLIALSPIVWENLNNSERGNKRRLIRHIEKLQQPAGEMTSPVGLEDFYQVLKIGVDCPREVLNQRIDQRVEKRIKQGMIEEGERLRDEGIGLDRMRELGLEYRELADLLSGEVDKAEFVAQLKTKIHQYAKRQQTWFKRETGVVWFDITQPKWQDKLVKKVADWYNR